LASGLVALLDDVAAIAKMAAASVDDVTAAAGRASAKAAGVVVDDAAVTPGYAMGFTPDRELPIIRKIAIGSLRNKFLILLPGALLISAFIPWALTPLLMAGGAYLCFEGAEKLIEKSSATTAWRRPATSPSAPRSGKRRWSGPPSGPTSSCRRRSPRSPWPTSPASRSPCRPPRSPSSAC
jgi:predicted DNA repair protein MutK